MCECIHTCIYMYYTVLGTIRTGCGGRILCNTCLSQLLQQRTNQEKLLQESLAQLHVRALNSTSPWIWWMVWFNWSAALRRSVVTATAFCPYAYNNFKSPVQLYFGLCIQNTCVSQCMYIHVQYMHMSIYMYTCTMYMHMYMYMFV